MAALIHAERLFDTILAQLNMVPCVAMKNITGIPILKIFPCDLPKILLNINAINL